MRNKRTFKRTFSGDRRGGTEGSGGVRAGEFALLCPIVRFLFWERFWDEREMCVLQCCGGEVKWWGRGEGRREVGGGPREGQKNREMYGK